LNNSLKMAVAALKELSQQLLPLSDQDEAAAVVSLTNRFSGSYQLGSMRRFSGNLYEPCKNDAQLFHCLTENLADKSMILLCGPGRHHFCTDDGCRRHLILASKTAADIMMSRSLRNPGDTAAAAAAAGFPGACGFFRPERSSTCWVATDKTWFWKVRYSLKRRNVYQVKLLLQRRSVEAPAAAGHDASTSPRRSSSEDSDGDHANNNLEEDVAADVDDGADSSDAASDPVATSSEADAGASGHDDFSDNRPLNIGCRVLQCMYCRAFETPHEGLLLAHIDNSHGTREVARETRKH
jgi:hypothetical protein